MVRKITKYKELVQKGLPAVLIPGIIFASIYGLKNLDKIKNYYQSNLIFPKSGIVEDVEDGDTFVLKGGQRVRLIGINAPNRSNKTNADEEAMAMLGDMVTDEKVWLEYDRYQDDKYGRILAWVWVGCESEKPKYTQANYMHLSGNRSKDYIKGKPEGCKKGTLVNKRMVDKGWAEAVEYEKRGRLKYRLE